MGKKDKNQAPHSGDTKAVAGVAGFAGLPRCVMESEAYRCLSMIARAILLEFVREMKGYNNDQITLSYKQLAFRLNRKNEAPIGPCIAELMEHGLVDISDESVWQERKAREYRLTFVNTTDSIGRKIPATNDYKRWRAKNDATTVVARKPKSATTSVAGMYDAATTPVAGNGRNLRKTKIEPATTGVVPISKPYAIAESEAGTRLN